MKLNTDTLGWLVALGLGGIVLASGFQGAPQKAAVADLAKIMSQSDIYKAKDGQILRESTARDDLMKFMSQYSVISVSQLTRLKDLSLKDAPTDAEKAELTKLKDDIKANTAKYADLVKKPTKTADDTAQIGEFGQYAQQIEQVLPRYAQDFNGELQRERAAGLQQIQDQARAAAQAVGKEQGYDLVFDMAIAPYGEHDVTDAALLRMNKK